ncbi:MAG: hypothetical protein E7164_03605 [Firmicutes bacterium]|nr:hypothetical protein [Bacillota bacterium]
MNYEDRGLGIGDLTIGVSTTGLENYKAGLKAELLTTVEEKINDYSAVKSALDKGWQGVSRDNFERQFENMRKQVIEDLRLEYANIEARIEELANKYIRQDQSMIVMD